MQVQRVQYTGRRAKIGGICFIEDRMAVFVGYCPDCKGKVSMTLDEAREFANVYGVNKNRTSEQLFRRMVKARKIKA